MMIPRLNEPTAIEEAASSKGIPANNTTNGTLMIRCSHMPAYA